MQINILLEKIVNNTLSDEPLILKYSDDKQKFIYNQYIDKIAETKHLTKQYTDNPEDAIDDNGFDDISTVLYVYEVEKLEISISKEAKNLIVLCKDIVYSQSIDFVEPIKIENWHIQDHIRFRLQGLEEKDILNLCNITNYDIYRLDRECKKIEIFPPASRTVIYNQINDENGYCDLTDKTLFDFTKALIDRNYEAQSELIKRAEVVDIEPLAFPRVLLKEYKKILAALSGNMAEMNKFKFTDKQKAFLPKYYKNNLHYTEQEVIRKIEFLTSMDYKIKTGLLDLSWISLLNYLVINLV